MISSWALTPDEAGFGSTARDLARRAGLEPDGRGVVDRVLLDTFDWRLYAAGYELLAETDDRAAGAEGEIWLILRRAAAEVVARQRAARVPRLADDLPAGPLRRRVARLLEMRALLPQAEMRVRQSRYRRRDRADKVVARVRFEDLEVRGPSRHGDDLGSRVLVEAIRGYEKPARRVADRLADELGLALGPDDLTSAALHAVGRRPGSRGEAFDAVLDPDEPADRALARLFLRLLEVIEANEPGLRDDLDTEFLHDYRVAVRRTRTLLRVAQSVFPAGVLDPFESGFRDLARATGPTRDLDVYLLDFTSLAAEVPAGARGDLEPLRAFLSVERERAFVDLSRVLDRPSHRRLLDGWRELLADDGPDVDRPPDPVPTTGQVADAVIGKAHRRVLREGRAIDEDSPAEALHDLRKYGKVLRYRVEAFSGLSDRGPVNDVVGDLKRLQDVLGEFQDSEVQASALRGAAASMAERGEGSSDCFLAMGLLIAGLVDRQRRARDRFQDAFASFDSPAARRHLERLLRDSREGMAA